MNLSEWSIGGVMVTGENRTLGEKYFTLFDTTKLAWDRNRASAVKGPQINLLAPEFYI